MIVLLSLTLSAFDKYCNRGRQVIRASDASGGESTDVHNCVFDL
jgi:hypothetical protein